MSSAAGDGDDEADISNPGETITYWCHSCQLTVCIPSPPPPLPSCPTCGSAAVEESEPEPPPPPSPTHLNFISEDAPTSPAHLNFSSEDEEPSYYDAYVEGSPAAAARAYLRRLLRTIADADALPSVRRGPSAASAEAIAAIPTVEVSDPSIHCAVCKDEFVVSTPARRLPCGHFYHSDCIVPWLERNNSCPICRSKIPGAELEPEVPQVSSSLAGRHITVRFRTIINSENEESGRRERRALRDALHQLRREVVGGGMASEGGTSSTQIARIGTADAVGPANSGETVTSSLVVAGGVAANGSTAGRIDEEGDMVMSSVVRDNEESLLE